MTRVDLLAQLAGPVDQDALLAAQLAHLGLDAGNAIVEADTITALVADRPRFGRWRIVDDAATTVCMTHRSLPTGLAFAPGIEIEPGTDALDEAACALEPIAAVLRFVLQSDR